MSEGYDSLGWREAGQNLCPALRTTLLQGVSASLSHGLQRDGKSLTSQGDGLFYERPSIFPTVKQKPGHFPRRPVAKAPSSQGRSPWVQSLVRELDPTCHREEFMCYS